MAQPLLAGDPPLSALLPDFAPCALTSYRKMATFDWKQLKLYMEGESTLRFKHLIWQTLERDPVFRHPKEELSLDKYRELTFLRCKTMFGTGLIRGDEISTDPLRILEVVNCLGMYDPSLCGKFNLDQQMFGGAIASMGTERHAKLVEQCDRFEIYGCFSLTELGHGSNVKALRTTATYDPVSKEFVVNTPELEAAKVWSGNMGQTATHALLFAQLITPDGVNQGLHPFVMPLRDPRTLLPLPGVEVGDMGLKAGLNGMDNGYTLFRHVRIPRENLLNRIGDVDESGHYESPIPTPFLRMAATLGALSFGRVTISSMSARNLHLGLAIALRYGAVRKQFGEPERPILELAMHQFRLMPMLAASIGIELVAKRLFLQQAELRRRMMDEDLSAAALGQEIHGMSCALKSLATWLAVEGLQECRECCGGMGYLAASRLPSLRNDHDPSVTYEGDNHVLLQQTAAFLISMRRHPQETPLGSVDFLSAPRSSSPAGARLDAPWALLRLDAFIADSIDKAEHAIQRRGDSFETRAYLQPLLLRSMSLAFGERIIIHAFVQFARDAPTSLQPVLHRLADLFALWSVDRRLGDMAARERALQLSEELKKDALALVDALAPPDFVLNSVLGRADGDVYPAIWSAMQAPSRPTWWTHFLDKPKSHL